MTGPRWSWLALSTLVVILASVWFVLRTRETRVAVDLLSEFSTAERRSALPADTAFKLLDVTIDAETRRCIFMHPASRLIYRVKLPEGAWVHSAIAIMPDVWDKAGSDGVLFRFGVSDGHTYTELFAQHVNPQSSPEDRRWFPVAVDLSSYAGQDVQLIFNTSTSLPGQGDNGTLDWAVWAEPQVRLGP